MKRTHRPENSGAALITTLILLGAVVLLTISYFSISRNEEKVSAYRLSATRADLAERAAFEDARNLLQALTDNDDYIVSSLMEDSVGTSEKSRYTFLTKVEEDELTHIPLFSGGRSESVRMPNISVTDTPTLASKSIAGPAVFFDGDTEEGQIETFGLTHLDESGSMVAENRFPETVFQEPELEPGDKFRMRYSYWIEDMEGLPNVDVVGGWTDHYSAKDGLGGTELIRPGYNSFDSRALPEGSSSRGARIELGRNHPLGWQFPKVFRGQRFTNQVAPGLSPREIILQPWETSQLALDEHPYYRAGSLSASRHWLAPGGSYVKDPGIRNENRFVLGLRPYVFAPKIPYGHEYPEEGEVRYNLNKYIRKREVSVDEGEGGLVQIISRNLPKFSQERRGGLPYNESYLGTLAANMIDYADEDSEPSNNRSTTSVSEPEIKFRGVDSYSVINEFFVRFAYLGYRDEGSKWIIEFEATPYAEFWNTFNKPAELKQAKLSFRFREPFQFKSNLRTHHINNIYRVLDEPYDIPRDITVPPNGYVVRSFGKIQWDVEIDKARNSPIAFPVIQDLRGRQRVTVRAGYDLSIMDELDEEYVEDGAEPFQYVKIDQSGRADRPIFMEVDPIRFGFFFKRHKEVMEPEDYFMRMTVPATAGKAYGFNEGFGSHLGDPFMSYYSMSTFEAATYDKKASPGYRNFDTDKAGRDYYKDETRVRDWPDGGYDGDVPPSVPTDDQMPDALTPPDNDPELAPWRISNEGRFFSVTELGNIYDPVMWIAGPVGKGDSVLTKQSTQLFDEHRDTHLRNLPLDAAPGKAWGGGNTLRIGRPEHRLFDRPGMRASQLLDIFQTGFTGTNLKGVDDSDELYENYDPRDHQPPPSAPSSEQSEDLPYVLIYPTGLHAEGIYQQKYGHLNINSAPSAFEIETLLRGPFASSAVLPVEGDRVEGPENTKPIDKQALENGLNDGTDGKIHKVALGLMTARPFLSPSHLARVLSQLMEEHEVLPRQASDAEMEETFARVFNTTTFSSRHFRIFTYGEIVYAKSGVVAGRSRRVYEVFLRPTHDGWGGVSDVKLEILSSREL